MVQGQMVGTFHSVPAIFSEVPYQLILWKSISQGNIDYLLRLKAIKKRPHQILIPHFELVINQFTNCCFVVQLLARGPDSKAILVGEPPIFQNLHSPPIPYSPSRPFLNNPSCLPKAPPRVTRTKPQLSISFRKSPLGKYRALKILDTKERLRIMN